MTSLINILDIEKRHRRSLKNYNKARHIGYDDAPYSNGAIALSYALPFVIALLVSVYFIRSCTVIEGGTLGVLVTVFSVFTGFLLNVLVLMYRIARDDDSEVETEDQERTSNPDDIKEAEQRLEEQTASAGRSVSIEREFSRQAYSNVSYSILLCIFSLVVLLGTSLITNYAISLILSSVIIFTLFHFLITLMIVLKRLHSMLFREFGLSE